MPFHGGSDGLRSSMKTPMTPHSRAAVPYASPPQAGYGHTGAGNSNGGTALWQQQHEHQSTLGGSGTVGTHQQQQQRYATSFKPHTAPLTGGGGDHPHSSTIGNGASSSSPAAGGIVIDSVATTNLAIARATETQQELYEAGYGLHATKNWPCCVPTLACYCLFATLIFAGATFTMAVVDTPLEDDKSLSLAFFSGIFALNAIFAFLDLIYSWSLAQKHVRQTWRQRQDAAGRTALVAIVNTVCLFPALLTYIMHQRGDEYWDSLKDNEHEERLWWLMICGGVLVLLCLLTVWFGLNRVVHGAFHPHTGHSIMGLGRTWLWRISTCVILANHAFFIYALVRSIEARYSTLSIAMTALYGLFAVPTIFLSLALPFSFRLDETIQLPRVWFDHYRSLILCSAGTCYAAMFSNILVLTLFGTQTHRVTMEERGASPYRAVRDLKTSREVIVWVTAATFAVYVFAVLGRLYIHKFSQVVAYTEFTKPNDSASGNLSGRPLVLSQGMGGSSSRSPSKQMTLTQQYYPRDDAHGSKDISMLDFGTPGEPRIVRSRTMSMSPSDALRLEQQRQSNVSPVRSFHSARPKAPESMKIRVHNDGGSSPLRNHTQSSGGGYAAAADGTNVSVLDSSHKVQRDGHGSVHVYR